MEEGQVPEVNLPNMRAEDVPQVVTAENNDTQENNEASFSSNSSLPLSYLSAAERALRNPLILQNLFQFCPVSILASCRLVSKQWYDESLASWRTSSLLTLGMYKTDVSFVHRGHFYCSDEEYLEGPALSPIPGTFTPLRQFLEFYSKPENHCHSKPHRNIRINVCTFSLNNVEFNSFWNEIGKNLTLLNLSHCKFAYVGEFREIIYTRCPLLQKLVIFYGKMLIRREAENELEYKEPEYGERKHLKTLSITYGGRREFPVSWMELFSHFSFLTSFEVTKMTGPDLEVETFIKVIQEIRKTDKRKLPFKRFQLHKPPVISRDPESILKFAMVKEFPLPLTHCPIEIHPELDQAFLKNTLEYLVPSLKIISIYPENMDNPAAQLPVPTWFRDFPFGIQMNNLTTLEFTGDVCKNLSFLKFVPNLAKLVIAEKQPLQHIETSFQSVTGAVVNTCKEELANLKMVRLTFLRLDYIVGSHDLRYLIKWMPNIMDLEMVLLNDEQFGIVSQNWKILRKLTVLGKELVTEAGIHSQIENASLEYLKSLHLEIYLSPKSILQLFLHLPSLQQLTYDTHRSGYVRREHLDMAAYQQAIQDGVMEEWIASNGHVVGHG